MAAACVLSLLPLAASAQTGSLADGLDGVVAERDRAEGEVGELRAREGDARAQLAAVDAELTAAEEELDTLRAERVAAEEALAAAEAAAAEAQAALARVSAELERTDAELATALGKLEARVVAAYKYGQVSLAEVLAGVRDFSDLVSSSTMVGHVLDADRLIVAEVDRLLRSVTHHQAQARQLQADAEREAAASSMAAAVIEAGARARGAPLRPAGAAAESRGLAESGLLAAV